MKWWIDRKVINDYFGSNLPYSGLFYTLKLDTPPWGGDTIIATNLDYIYLSRSGNKFVSNFLINYYENLPLSNAELRNISRALNAMYGDKWARLWQIVTAEYNPIENYRMVEHEEFANGDRTNRTIVTQGDVYGFNSSSPSPATRETESENGSTIDREGERDLTRSGNIGVTTSQQMIQSSIELYNNWLYFENVFQDVDSILTIPIY